MGLSGLLRHGPIPLFADRNRAPEQCEVGGTASANSEMISARLLTERLDEVRYVVDLTITERCFRHPLMGRNRDNPAEPYQGIVWRIRGFWKAWDVTAFELASTAPA